jgi:hypothetical protein
VDARTTWEEPLSFTKRKADELRSAPAGKSTSRAPSAIAGRVPTSTSTPKLSTPTMTPATGRAPPLEVRATVSSSTT